MKTNSKVKFGVRLALFITFALIIPFLYLTIRFNLWTSGSDNNSLKIGLWGVIALGVFMGTIIYLIHIYLSSLKTKYSYLKQVLEGFCKVIIPLVIGLALCVWLKDNINLMIETLAILIVCEGVAIFINPLPKWCFDNNVEGLQEIVSSLKLHVDTKDSQQ